MDKQIRLAIVLSLCSGCVAVVRPGRVAVAAPVDATAYVDREPPPRAYEPVPRPPGRDYVWIDGYWSWNARAYVWVPGRYLLRPHPRAAWIGGRWVRHARGWYWTEGHWR